MATQEGEPLETFTIMTTEPNELMEPIHNRMPVILASPRLQPLARPRRPGAHRWTCSAPFPPNRCVSWPVSNRVGNVRNNDSQLLEQF